jgi:hypothetical protein
MVPSSKDQPKRRHSGSENPHQRVSKRRSFSDRVDRRARQAAVGADGFPSAISREQLLRVHRRHQLLDPSQAVIVPPDYCNIEVGAVCPRTSPSDGPRPIALRSTSCLPATCTEGRRVGFRINEVRGSPHKCRNRRHPSVRRGASVGNRGTLRYRTCFVARVQAEEFRSVGQNWHGLSVDSSRGSMSKTPQR